MTGVISGRKCSAFRDNLRGCVDSVTLDTHMAKALSIPAARLASNGSEYDRASDTIRRVADRLGWTPRQAQAAIWCAVVRGLGQSPPAMDVVGSIGVVDASGVRIGGVQ